MNKRKEIKLRVGCQKKLAEELGTSAETVRAAMRWEKDTDLQNLIRQRARERGYIRRF